MEKEKRFCRKIIVSSSLRSCKAERFRNYFCASEWESLGSNAVRVNHLVLYEEAVELRSAMCGNV